LAKSSGCFLVKDIRMPARKKLLLLAFVALLLSSCKDKSITVYEAPKDSPTKHQHGETSAPTQANDLSWEKPEAWEATALSSFRKGSFSFTSADGQKVDISIIAFPEKAGGLLPNINRWRDQLNLPPISLDQLSDNTTAISIADQPATLVEIVSETAIIEEQFKSRTIAAILSENQQSWFFKMVGSDAAVLSQKETFLAFLASVKKQSPSEITQTHQEIVYQTPTSWKELPATSPRHASFQVKEVGDISIISFPGDVGGNLANINRWRGQIGLPPISDEDLDSMSETIMIGDNPALVIHLESKESILAAILPQGPKTWFIKFRGPSDVVADEKTTFLQFLQTIHFHAAH
jgi:hypothetical protein